MLLVKLVFSARKEKRAELKKELRTRRASEIESRSTKLHVCLSSLFLSSKIQHICDVFAKILSQKCSSMDQRFRSPDFILST